jgi:hypothetical protein
MGGYPARDRYQFEQPASSPNERGCRFVSHKEQRVAISELSVEHGDAVSGKGREDSELDGIALAHA